MDSKLAVVLTLVFGTLMMIGAYYLYSLKNSYELSERCGKSAREHFKSLEYDSPFAGYENHYNTKLNKCFIMVANMSFDQKDSSVTDIRDLEDVNESKNIGRFISPMNGELRACFVNGKKCNSLDEWRTLIDPYMEQ